MIGKYKKLKQDFENLEKEYSREVAKNLDLQYEYDNLKADYTNETIQRAEIERLHENTRRLKHDMKIILWCLYRILTTERLNRLRIIFQMCLII